MWIGCELGQLDRIPFRSFCHPLESGLNSYVFAMCVNVGLTFGRDGDLDIANLLRFDIFCRHELPGSDSNDGFFRDRCH